jgi:hypothetical protein
MSNHIKGITWIPWQIGWPPSSALTFWAKEVLPWLSRLRLALYLRHFRSHNTLPNFSTGVQLKLRKHPNAYREVLLWLRRLERWMEVNLFVKVFLVPGSRATTVSKISISIIPRIYMIQEHVLSEVQVIPFIWLDIFYTCHESWLTSIWTWKVC